MPINAKPPKARVKAELTSIAEALNVLKKYDAHVPCGNQAFNCPQCLLNRTYADLRGFAMFLAE